MAASLARAWNGHWKSAKSSSERDVHVGVEYETGEHEYHGLLAHPYELHDTYGSLAPEQRAKTFPRFLYASAPPPESLRISLAEPRRAMLPR